MRTELAQTFAIAYYRQAGPPAITEFQLIDQATGATVVDAEWDTVNSRERSLHVYQPQPVQLGRDYAAWIAFDKPMRWLEGGAVAILPGQEASSADVSFGLSAKGITLTTPVDAPQWVTAPGGAPAGYAHYMTDALIMTVNYPADTSNQAAIAGQTHATLEMLAGDMTGLQTDANPATVARFENGGWSGYENDAGVDFTDTGGADSTLSYTITSSVLGDPFVIEAGTSGAWFDPDRDGEGFVLEILGGNKAVIYWFTYDDSGGQDWYIAIGTIHGNRIAFPQLLHYSGGEFGPGFDPEKVTESVVGSASFIWSGCDSGEMEWELNGNGDYRHGRMRLQRLSRLMGIDCSDVPPLSPIREEALLSGAWFDPTHSGEGYILEFLTDSRAVVYWFSFDAAGNQRWFIGVGGLKTGKLVFDDMLTTRGASFGEAFNPLAVETSPWGSLVLDLQCQTGKASFKPTEPGFPAGTLNLKRLTVLP
ncbi:MAG: hypothetical protein ACREO9_05360, partial [Lysobacterales bacterium]